MSKVAVVTDSTAYIPEILTASKNFQIVPLTVIFGDDNYLDGVNLNPEDFYVRLQNSKVMPSTSQPSPDAFKKVFQELLDEGYDIISMHISLNLSGTVNSAIQAKQDLGVDNIEVINSQLTTMALGFPILAVMEAAEEGATLEECKAIAENCLKNSGALFVVDTLEFLHRGGRINSASAFLGTALNLKPILSLIDGKIEAIDKVRTKKKALNKMLQLFDKRIPNDAPIYLAAVHANAEEEAEQLLEKAKGMFETSRIQQTVITQISPVLGTHTGPGCVSINYMFDTK